jgi:hypothetical protein
VKKNNKAIILEQTWGLKPGVYIRFISFHYLINIVTSLTPEKYIRV